jgi:hypothetical protein
MVYSWVQDQKKKKINKKKEYKEVDVEDREESRTSWYISNILSVIVN